MARTKTQRSFIRATTLLIGSAVLAGIVMTTTEIEIEHEDMQRTLHCEMVAIWNEGEAMGLSREERFGWPAEVNMNIDCTDKD